MHKTSRFYLEKGRNPLVSCMNSRQAARENSLTSWVFLPSILILSTFPFLFQRLQNEAFFLSLRGASYGARGVNQVGGDTWSRLATP